MGRNGRPTGDPEIRRGAPWQTRKEGRVHYDGDILSRGGRLRRHIDPKVVLIDGRRLAELMIDFDLAVNTSATYSVKRLDSDYFDETGAV